MQKVRLGDIMTVNKGIIVHGCNAQGVMGSGVAAHMRAKYPEVFADYRKQHEERGLRQGEIVTTPITPELIVISAITQENYGRDGKKYVSYWAICHAMEQIANIAAELDLSVHYPQIGAGLGGGDWCIIQAVIDTAFSSHPDVQRYLWILE